jgi:hypothetical protein
MLSNDVRDILSDATVEFALAPDAFIDVGRLPVSVTNLSTLVDYLRTIQQKLAKRDNKVKTEDWDVAKSGELRLYKFYVCAIHALSNYIEGAPAVNVTHVVFAQAVATHASGNPPADLAENGSKLWKQTFNGNQPRTISVIMSLLYFCHREANPGGPAPPPGPPAPVAITTGPGSSASSTSSPTPIPRPPTTIVKGKSEESKVQETGTMIPPTATRKGVTRNV